MRVCAFYPRDLSEKGSRAHIVHVVILLSYVTHTSANKVLDRRDLHHHILQYTNKVFDRKVLDGM